jgi:sec-independent protein translocase protein TatA
MEGKIGVPELLFILGVALLVFGPSKLGDLGRSLGEAIRGFRSAMNGPTHSDKAAK